MTDYRALGTKARLDGDPRSPYLALGDAFTSERALTWLGGWDDACLAAGVPGVTVATHHGPWCDLGDVRDACDACRERWLHSPTADYGPEACHRCGRRLDAPTPCVDFVTGDEYDHHRDEPIGAGL